MTYMVYVEGHGGPTKHHETLESATTEAKRVADQPKNRNCNVFVLQVVGTFKPVYSCEWVPA